MPVTWDTHELAWAAGFFDGEGTTCATRNHQRSDGSFQLTPKLSVCQKTPETLERFRRAVGVGKLRHYERWTRGGFKPNSPLYMLDVRRWNDIQYALCLLWKYLSTAKREQAHKAMMACKAQWEEHPPNRTLLQEVCHS